jgi:hypothetical protein
MSGVKTSNERFKRITSHSQFIKRLEHSQSIDDPQRVPLSSLVSIRLHNARVKALEDLPKLKTERETCSVVLRLVSLDADLGESVYGGEEDGNDDELLLLAAISGIWERDGTEAVSGLDRVLVTKRHENIDDESS